MIIAIADILGLRVRGNLRLEVRMRPVNARQHLSAAHPLPIAEPSSPSTMLKAKEPMHLKNDICVVGVIDTPGGAILSSSPPAIFL